MSYVGEIRARTDRTSGSSLLEEDAASQRKPQFDSRSAERGGQGVSEYRGGNRGRAITAARASSQLARGWRNVTRKPNISPVHLIRTPRPRRRLIGCILRSGSRGASCWRVPNWTPCFLVRLEPPAISSEHEPRGGQSVSRSHGHPRWRFQRAGRQADRLKFEECRDL